MERSLDIDPRNDVRELRMSYGLSQAVLGSALDVSRQTVNAIEAGRYSPSLPLAMKLARFFGTAVEEIFHADDNPWWFFRPRTTRETAGRRTRRRARPGHRRRHSPRRRVGLGLAFLAIMWAVAALLLIGSHFRDTIALLGDDRREARHGHIHQRAALHTLNVLALAIIAAILVDVAGGGDGGHPYTWLGFIGGLSYTVFLVVLNRRT